MLYSDHILQNVTLIILLKPLKSGTKILAMKYVALTQHWKKLLHWFFFFFKLQMHPMGAEDTILKAALLVVVIASWWYFLLTYGS